MAKETITYQILPKDTKAFKLPNRVIGSGRITRRIPIKHLKQRFIKRNNKSYHANTPYKDKNLPIALNSKSKRIWLHWIETDSLTFTKHKDINGKTKQKSITRINRALKKFTIQEIIAAIDLAAFCFSAKWFYPKLKKLSCFSFFEYDAWELQNMQTPIEGRSWLAEFIKGKDYIEDNYRRLAKDESPEVTAMVEDLYRINQGYAEGQLTINEQNALIKCAQKVVKFTEANGLEWAGNVIAPLQRIINNPEKPFTLNNPYFLCSADLWERQLPREMVRYGTFARRSDIALI